MRTADRIRPGYGGRAAFDLGTTTSTVTVWDPQEATYPSLSPVQRHKLADAFADLFDQEPPGGSGLRIAWREFGCSVADKLSPVPGRVERVGTAERLRTRDGHRTALDTVITELERACVNGTSEMRRYLTPQLARCYREALAVPPLDSLRYHRAYLEGRTHDELPSVVWDTHEQNARRFRLGSRPESDGQLWEPVAYRGLKQQLGRRTPRQFGSSDGPTLDQLMTGALNDLTYRTNRYLENFRTELNLIRGELVDVVLTYPTMAPLSARNKLRSMMGQVGILTLDTSFDEAVAAAMFYVLRSVGGRTDMAVESFSSRCDPVPGENLTPDGRPTAWQQHVLIVDVGGGTVDIALIRLGLRDETDRTAPGADSPHYGRYFRLKPTLLGTTGDSQRGGDFVTLQVFRWIKVLLANHVLMSSPRVAESVRDQLGRRYFDAYDVYLPDKLVTSALDVLSDLSQAAAAAGHVVPTQWRDTTPGLRGSAAEREQLFTKLWEIAEQAKIDLGVHETVEVDDIALRAVFDSLREMHEAVGGESLTAPRILLRQQDFVHLLEPEIRQTMNLAADLVATRLPNDQLHQVVLTGRGSLLPQVRAQLVQALSRWFTEEPVPRPVPPILSYGDAYAKHAASIGACWASTVDRRTQENVRARLADGVTWLTVEVDNLFRSMPAAFVVPAAAEIGPSGTTPLFGMDAELRPTEAGGEPVVRAGWVQYQNPFRVDRLKAFEISHQWAYLRLEEFFKVEELDGHKFGPALARELFVQVEASASLEMWALVCRGGVPDITLPHASTSMRLVEPVDRFDVVLDDVVADPTITGFMDDSMPEPVFTAGDAFDCVLVVGGSRRRAKISGPLEVPQAHGWRFHRSTGGNYAEPVVIPAPDCADGLRHHAVLDETGILHVVAGPPPYRAAQNLQELLDSPGSVLRLMMTSAEPDYQSQSDPFTGLQ
ncbi:hypothetical protein [Umezawaea tangerina]|uniref:hypothetical protein n=1 Tax=Umezawaea tangerina TaxID=84725 RepID=UPI000D080F50|nr:hypothetical protein [Umezawaea tangerina]